MTGPHEDAPGDEPVPARYPDRDKLSAAENERLFREQIVPFEFADVRPPASAGAAGPVGPVVIFTGGQPGSGKSQLKTLLTGAFGGDGYVDIGTDSLRVHHPRWEQLLREDDVTAGAYTQLDAQAWVARSVAEAVERGVHVLMDSTLSRESEVDGYLQQFRARGYRIEIAFVAAPLAVSWLGNLQRYQRQYEEKGHGRVSMRGPYERTSAQILTTARRLEERGVADRISVYRRGGELLYHNTRDPGTGAWTDPPRIGEVIEHERARDWTPDETTAFVEQFLDLTDRMPPRWQPDLEYALELAGDRIAPEARAHAEALTRGPGTTDPPAAQRSAAPITRPAGPDSTEGQPLGEVVADWQRRRTAGGEDSPTDPDELGGDHLGQAPPGTNSGLGSTT